LPILTSKPTTTIKEGEARKITTVTMTVMTADTDNGIEITTTKMKAAWIR
jgi:hypothetical protein